MSVSSPIFSDRIVNVAVTGQLVRLELGMIQVPSGEGQSPQLVPASTVVMPLDGFVASMGMLDSVMKKMLADGVLRLQTPPPAAAEGAKPA
jgi:hypothetical protein